MERTETRIARSWNGCAVASAGATLHVDVKSVAPFYAQANAVIAPIFFGGGPRVKIIEAMAVGIPIVATRFGVEGIAIRDGVPAMLGTRRRRSTTRWSRWPTIRRCASASRRARDLHQERYGAAALKVAVRATLEKTSLALRPDAPARAEARLEAPRRNWSLHDQAVAA